MLKMAALLVQTPGGVRQPLYATQSSAFGRCVHFEMRYPAVASAVGRGFS
jgi:hypothetical protein